MNQREYTARRAGQPRSCCLTRGGLLARLVATALAAAIVATAPLVADEARTWTDATGKHKTLAEYVSFADGVVTLRKPGTDKTLKMPLERLCLEDQQYVRELLEQDNAKPEQGDADPDETEPGKTSTAADGEERPAATPGPRIPSTGGVVNSVRAAVLRTDTRNNMRQLAVALVAYESTNERFPKAAAFQTADGKPGLSWRVAILPLLDEQALFDQFRKNEPWDSPHNRQLIEKMPALFASPGAKLEKGYTNYLAVVGPNTILCNGRRGSATRDIRDGTSRTIMFVEADDEAAVPWTKPDDLVVDPQQPTKSLGQIWSGQFHAAFGDGAVRALTLDIDPKAVHAAFTRDGGENLRLDE